MTQSNVGRWVSLDPTQLVSPTTDSGFQVLPSPFDIPVAVRINEGDPSDPSYAVEVLYLGGTGEKTQKQHASDIDVEVGSRSGRVYRLLIDAKWVARGARSRLTEVARSVAGLSAENRGNAEMVCRAVELHENELVQQLSALGRTVRSRDLSR